jgi:hypothetical protein
MRAAWSHRAAGALLALVLVAPRPRAAGEDGAAAAVVCAHGETLNPATEQCACTHGYGGRDCGEELHPACFAEPRRGNASVAAGGTWPRHAFCSAYGALSCACLAQCAALPSAANWRDGPCYARAAGSTLSAVPAADEPGVTFLRSWRDNASAVPAAEALANPEGQRYLPVAACERNCSGEGLCLGDAAGAAPRCACFAGRGGPACEAASQDDACMLRCSGRGECVRGVCVCAPGWFGMACLDRADHVARTRAAPPPPRRHALAIFIWEPPDRLGLAAVADSVADRGVGPAVPNATARTDYASEWSFLYRLLGDARHRVATPEEANLFFVPTFATAFGDVHGGARVVAHLDSLVAHLNSTQPAARFWARRGGADFVFWAGGDLGACALPPHLRNIILATTYGQTDLRNRYGGLAELAPCVTSPRGVVVPGTAPAQPLPVAALTYDPPAAARPRRDTLFFFAGSIGGVHDEGYSQGVRWRVVEAWAKVSDAYVVDTARLPPGYAPLTAEAMFARMRRAVFCLAPSGHGWGVRITYAMLTGCIPVVIQDGVRQPFDDVLPYWRFSLRLAQADVPDLERILRAVPPADVAELQAGVERYFPYFVWCGSEVECLAAGGRARAYHGVLDSLRRKLYNALGGFGS